MFSRSKLVKRTGSVLMNFGNKAQNAFLLIVVTSVVVATSTDVGLGA